MRDYTKSITDLPDETIDKVKKIIDLYSKSYLDKGGLQNLYEHLLKAYRKREKPTVVPDLFEKAFSAKNFWKDLQDCGSWLEMRYWYDHDKTKLHHANFCKRDKLCAPCAVRRAYKQQNKFFDIMRAEPDLLAKDWFYIVMPVKHNRAEPLEVVLQRVAKMKKALINSIRLKRQRNRHGRPVASRAFWSAFDGGMFAEEITKTRNGWNVHLNLLMNAPAGTTFDLVEYRQIWNDKEKVTLSSPELSEWMKENANGSVINSVQKLDFSNEDSLRSALVEVLKYSLKFHSLNRVEMLEVFAKTVRHRFFGTFGNLWGKGLTADIELDGDFELDGEFLEMIFTRSKFGEYNMYKREIKHNGKVEDEE